MAAPFHLLAKVYHWEGGGGSERNETHFSHKDAFLIPHVNGVTDVTSKAMVWLRVAA